MAKRTKKDINFKKKVITMFQIVFIAMLIISSIEIIKWVIENKENQKLNNEIAKAITIEETEQINNKSTKYNVDFTKLKEKNGDTVAWLKVNGTDIEYTVVKSNDNSYYLNHNFEQEHNQAGWIFADFRNKLDGTDKNIVIYGHNRRDGSMFGSLKNILNADWYENVENRKVTLITENENCTYEVFSIYQIESEEYYITTNFEEVDFLKYIDVVKKRSIKDFNIEVTEEDNILTLSTCGNNSKYRVVLHAKKIVY